MCSSSEPATVPAAPAAQVARRENPSASPVEPNKVGFGLSGGIKKKAIVSRRPSSLSPSVFKADDEEEDNNLYSRGSGMAPPKLEYTEEERRLIDSAKTSSQVHRLGNVVVTVLIGLVQRAREAEKQKNLINSIPVEADDLFAYSVSL